MKRTRTGTRYVQAGPLSGDGRIQPEFCPEKRGGTDVRRKSVPLLVLDAWFQHQPTPNFWRFLSILRQSHALQREGYVAIAVGCEEFR
jgi:hypothetical protein